MDQFSDDDARSPAEPLPSSTHVAVQADHAPPPAKSGRVGIFRPLRIKDFALLWTGMTVSLAGDGIFLVAIAFQVYALANDPGALSLVFFAWTGTATPIFLLSGVMSDRFDRRLMMIAADVIRAGALAVMGFLSVTGDLTLTHMYIAAAAYGFGDALFMPAFTAIVPDIVPKHLLLEANSLDSFVRPLTQRMLGPALGGALIAMVGPGQAFIVDAVTFVFSAACVAAIGKRPQVKRQTGLRSAIGDIADGFRFVRAHTWIWGTLLSASVGLLAFIGPLEVLVPYVVKNQMGGDASSYGLILAIGGVGAVITSVAMGQFGLPKRHITFMYGVWGVGVLLVATFAYADRVWQGMIASFAMTAMFTAGMIVWTTLLHKLVPADILGRVSSLDWLISTGLVPVSFVLTGPIAEAIGVDNTLIGAGVIGCILTWVFLLLPGIRDTEKDASALAETVESARV